MRFIDDKIDLVLHPVVPGLRVDIYFTFTYLLTMKKMQSFKEII